jgi:hypothetical protein
MTPFAISQELKFREEMTKRTLEELFELQDWDQLMNAALLLNSMWHQQTAIARWFAHEAAENLSEAWAMSARKD